jgi:hypothetical protein
VTRIRNPRGFTKHSADECSVCAKPKHHKAKRLEEIAKREVLTDDPIYTCPQCGHVWGAYEDYCHCTFGTCHNKDACHETD